MKKEEKKVSKKVEVTDKKKVDNKKSKNKNVDNKKRDKSITEKKNTKKVKSKRENLFKLILKYFKGVGKEIKRIRWTTGKELFKYSIAAIMFVLFFGIYFYGVNWIAILIRDFNEVVESIRSLVK